MDRKRQRFFSAEHTAVSISRLSKAHFIQQRVESERVLFAFPYEARILHALEYSQSLYALSQRPHRLTAYPHIALKKTRTDSAFLISDRLSDLSDGQLPFLSACFPFCKDTMRIFYALKKTQLP